MASQAELTTSRLPGQAATAPSGQSVAAPQGKRLLFVDNLRILLICGVVVQHLNDTYGAAGSWMYTDPTTDQFTSILLSLLSIAPMAAGMGFFFLLAGYFTPRSYDRKGGAAFVRDRLIRLGLPWLVYALLIEPLVLYIAHGLPGSFWSFYTTGYLHGVDSIADGVIWFVELLLFFSLLYAAWRWLTRSRLQVASGEAAVPGSWTILGFILALGLGSFVVCIWWPVTYQPGPLSIPLGYLLQYVCFFVLGIVAYRRNWLEKLTPRMGRNWALIALLASLLFFGLAAYYAATAWKQAVSEGAGGFHWLSLINTLWGSFVIVGVCLGLLVLFRERLNQQGRLAKSLAASAYTVYLIHPVVLVGFAYAFHVVALYPLLKWAIALLITIPLCFLISSGIRRIPLVNRVV